MQNLFGGYNPYPYIYIQYSHDDAEKVIPIIKYLRSRNYNVVYDKNFGEEDRYRYLNVQQITQAASFLLFYSKSAAKSRLIKECVRFAVPMYNLEKICVCLDDTKFGFSFSDLKKNYTIIEETQTDEILKALRPFMEVYILPNSGSSGNSLSSEPEVLKESDFADELQEISLTETADEKENTDAPTLPVKVENASDEDNNKPDDISKDVEIISDKSLPGEDEFILPEDEISQSTTEKKQHPVITNQLPDSRSASENDVSADAPEAFPDFEMSDEYEEVSGLFDIPQLPNYFRSIPDTLPIPQRIGEKLRSEKVQRNPEPEKLQRNPEPEKIQRKPEPEKIQRKPEPEKLQRKPEPEKLQWKPEPEKLQRNPEPEKLQRNPEPEKLQRKPEPEKLQRKPEQQTPSEKEDLWIDLRRKMRVRAMNKTRFFAKPKNHEFRRDESLEPGYVQDDTIESITINYPTDEDVPDYYPSPEPIKLNKSFEKTTDINPDVEISEINHRPEPAEPGTKIRRHVPVEYVPRFTDNPPPSEVLPVPVSEPATETGSVYIPEEPLAYVTYDSETYYMEDETEIDDSAAEYTKSEPEPESEPEP